MTIPSTNTIGMMPPISNISKDIISQNDIDSDDALSLEELGIDEEAFNSLDSDSDGLLSQTEIASAIEGKLSELNGEMPSPEEFSSLLSDLGLEMPEPPEKPENSFISDFASELMSAYDTDGDSLLSSEEVSLLSSEEFEALDTNADGSISTDELTSAIEEVADGSAPPPPPAGGAPMGGESSEEDEEFFSALDTNEDGVVSQEELEAAYGIATEEASGSELSSSDQAALNNLEILMEALKSSGEESIDQNSFSGVLKLINAQNNNSELNTYLSNTNTSKLQSYA